MKVSPIVSRSQIGLPESRILKIPFAQLAAAFLVVVLGATAPATFAAPFVWQQTDNLQSVLGDPSAYSSSSPTATVTYENQTATNTGATTEHMGMYIGWVWSYDSVEASTPLPWSNASNAFVGGAVASFTVSRLGFADQTLALNTIVGDTWIGNPWATTVWEGDTPIATQSDWVVPFFDFGILASGASVSYDLSFTLTFTDEAAFKDWDKGGSFYVSAQGVQTVPEAGSSLALLLGSLTGLAVVCQRFRKLNS
jgi:hypothetical protein